MSPAVRRLTEKTAWILRPTPPGYRTSGGVGWLAGAKFHLNCGAHPAKNARGRKVLFVRYGLIFIVCTICAAMIGAIQRLPLKARRSRQRCAAGACGARSDRPGP